MILLAGVTGLVGEALVAEVSAKGVPVKAFVRDKTRGAELAAAGLKITYGDLTDQTTLRAALEGCTKAFLLTGNSEQQLDIECSFIDAAKSGGVAHVVKMSATGADATSDAPFSRNHGEIEQHLQNSGLAFTNVRPNFFMQNMLRFGAPIASQSKFFLPMGSGQVGTIDVKDVATFVLSTLTEPGHDNKTYEISGPELLSFSDIAKRFSHVLSRTIEYMDIPIEAFVTELQSFGLSPWYAGAVGALFAKIAAGSSAHTTDTLKQVIGHPGRRIDDFIADNRQHFAG